MKTKNIRHPRQPKHHRKNAFQKNTIRIVVESYPCRASIGSKEYYTNCSGVLSL